MGRRGRGALAPDVAAKIALGSLASNGAKDMQLRTAERPAIVAEMALAAPGRVDLVDMLIERPREGDRPSGWRLAERVAAGRVGGRWPG